MPKLKWDILVPDSYGSFYEEHGPRMALAATASIIPYVFGIGMLVDGVLAAGIPLLIIANIIFVGLGVFGFLIPKLHYLYGLGHSQREAIKWYEALTNSERAQLPEGWETLVREHGGTIVVNEDSPYYHQHSVADDMLESAKNVVHLYREKNKQAEVPDFRIDLYLSLMKEKADELNKDIADRKEIEAKIASMP